MDMGDITERLKDILATDGKNVKDIDVANALGINPNTYAQMKFRNAVPYEQIMRFLAKRKISINLFFFGQESGKLKESEKRYKTLKLFNAKASLGGGAWNSDDEDFEEVMVDKKIMDKLVGNVSKTHECHIISGTGDSMEPHILDGDLCIIGVGIPFKNGEVYAVNTPDGVVLKECYKQNDELMLVSYNPLYTPIRFFECECKIIGRFLGVFRAENIKLL
ncbi:LexA family transcriptional regulator [Campylobacter fetus]|uniref:LexA family transcriptional regulator n=2 Tax=Campylobacter fetus TaxID=196 RepID=UPI00138E24C4|nr:S24 family peptidase [Campylobacter fetus]